MKTFADDRSNSLLLTPDPPDSTGGGYSGGGSRAAAFGGSSNDAWWSSGAGGGARVWVVELGCGRRSSERGRWLRVWVVALGARAAASSMGGAEGADPTLGSNMWAYSFLPAARGQLHVLFTRVKRISGQVVKSHPVFFLGSRMKREGRRRVGQVPAWQPPPPPYVRAR
uniref:Uncharacterized protein n=1 Tax=Oryza punctata TaxID=4537 RepID=A0A0E0K167_ORYPU